MDEREYRKDLVDSIKCTWGDKYTRLYLFSLTTEELEKLEATFPRREISSENE